MKETLKNIYKNIDNDKDIKLKKKVEEKQIKSKPYVPKIAYYRYVKFSYGGQGCCDTSEPLTSWKPLMKYSDKEMNEWNIKFPRENWYELRIEIKFE